MWFRHGRREKPKPKEKAKRSKIGFTNWLAMALVSLLFAGLAGGFFLAVLSIRYGYMGQLLCWTAVFTPIGTALSIVLARIVDKSRAENTGGNGDGIKYAIAMKQADSASEQPYSNSPPI